MDGGIRWWTRPTARTTGRKIPAPVCLLRQKILPESALDAAQKGYEGVIRSLNWEGSDLLIGNVCVGTGVGGYDFYCCRPGDPRDLHGVGAFLLMCTELQSVLAS